MKAFLKSALSISWSAFYSTAVTLTMAVSLAHAAPSETPADAEAIKQKALGDFQASPYYQQNCSTKGDGVHTCQVETPAGKKEVVIDTNVSINAADYSDAPGSSIFAFTSADDAIKTGKGDYIVFSNVSLGHDEGSKSKAGPSTSIWYGVTDGLQLRVGLNGVAQATDTDWETGDALLGAKLNLFNTADGRLGIAAATSFNFNLGKGARDAELTSPSGVAPQIITSFALTPKFTAMAYMLKSFAFNRSGDTTTTGTQLAYAPASRLTLYAGADRSRGADRSTTVYSGLAVGVNKKNTWAVVLGYARTLRTSSHQISIGVSKTGP